MQILSHRGFWIDPKEKNTDIAFRRSFELGFGTETDVRDLDGELVISHDPAKHPAMSFEKFLDIYGECNLPLALNIKADGLANRVNSAMGSRNLGNWFVFDMSIPDTRHQFSAGNPVFMRSSEFETNIPWFDKASGIWLDAFEGEWYLDGELQTILSSGKTVCVVSSELHGRSHASLWHKLADLTHFDNLMLCTDFPTDAQKFFGAVHD
jgi:glycerophosphoryl diester phosphodiesterase